MPKNQGGDDEVKSDYEKKILCKGCGEYLGYAQDSLVDSLCIDCYDCLPTHIVSFKTSTNLP